MTNNQKQLNEQLFKAIEQNSIEDLKHIIEQGADLEASNIYGFTSVTCAVFLDRPNCLQLLIEAGADLFNMDSHGFTPHKRACACGDDECANIIADAINTQDLTTLDKQLFDAIVEYSEHKNLNKIEELLKQGANPNMKINNDYNRIKKVTLLYWMVESTIDNHYYVYEDLDIYKLLLKYKANPYINNDKSIRYSGGSPIYLAFRYSSYKKIAKCLVENACKDFNINTQNIDGDTVLHEVYDFEDAVQFLIDHGADPTIKNNHGLSALNLATNNEEFKCAQIMRKALEK